jgi:hypothetical protein
MAETVLPGVSIEVRDEGLIIPLGVTVGNLGVVGTASKGPIGVPQILGSYSEARATFGDYDLWQDGTADELTLVRALELAYRHGATTVLAVRVAATGVGGAAKASSNLASTGGTGVVLRAQSEGTWANDLEVNVAPATEAAFVEDEPVAATLQLGFAPVVQSARNRIRLKPSGGGLEQTLQVLYDSAATLGPGQVNVETANGKLHFAAPPAPGTQVLASYMVDKSKATLVTLRLGDAKETYTVVSGADLARDLAASVWVDGDAATADPLALSNPAGTFARFAGGGNGASGANYAAGLETLLNEPAHILVAAGQDERFGSDLAAHCEVASSDVYQRNRIAVVGSSSPTSRSAFLSLVLGHSLNSDRLIFVAPGIKATDAAAVPPVTVTLPGAYAAAAVAGLLASFPPHISLTNKALSVNGLEYVLTRAELSQVVQSRVLALALQDGIRTVKGITTSTNTAFAQITTRRIVDFASFGVRSAARPFIGRLNNDRVRGALRTAINSFLVDMVTDEMLISYELNVAATRDQEIRGIVQVTMVLRPVFSIDFIKVVIFLQ